MSEGGKSWLEFFPFGSGSKGVRGQRGLSGGGIPWKNTRDPEKNCSSTCQGSRKGKRGKTQKGKII